MSAKGAKIFKTKCRQRLQQQFVSCRVWHGTTERAALTCSRRRARISIARVARAPAAAARALLQATRLFRDVRAARARRPPPRRRRDVASMASSTQVQRLPHGGRRRQQQAGSQPPRHLREQGRTSKRLRLLRRFQKCGRDLGRRGHGRLAEGAEEVHQGRDSGVIYSSRRL